NGTLKTVPELKQHFLDKGLLVESDSLFKARFKQYPFDRPNGHTRARAVLYALEYAKSNKKSGLKPRDTLTVEHVLPKSPAKGQWKQFDASARRAYTYNLGNLLLIDGPSGANDDLANTEWKDKRALIQSWPGQTPLTDEAVKSATWTKATITSRQNTLAA